MTQTKFGDHLKMLTMRDALENLKSFCNLTISLIGDQVISNFESLCWKKNQIYSFSVLFPLEKRGI